MADPIKKFFELLSKWNAELNLTAIKDWDDFLLRHVEDSRSLLPYLAEVRTLIDLGTGAGVPGIIIKILRPEIDVTLLDSTRKKISFCDEAIRELNLSGIRSVWGRAEDDVLQNKLGRFDCVVSRATWELKKFLPIAAHYINDMGKIIAMKGSKWNEELGESVEVIEKEELKLTTSATYELKGNVQRAILIFRL
jgi:16S rRNA (guanine527-N7)-methyltransferase